MTHYNNSCKTRERTIDAKRALAPLDNKSDFRVVTEIRILGIADRSIFQHQIISARCKKMAASGNHKGQV